MNGIQITLGKMYAVVVLEFTLIICGQHIGHSDTQLNNIPLYMSQCMRLVCATSKASDQTAHTRSLIRAFASRLSIL